MAHQASHAVTDNIRAERRLTSGFLTDNTDVANDRFGRVARLAHPADLGGNRTFE